MSMMSRTTACRSALRCRRPWLSASGHRDAFQGRKEGRKGSSVHVDDAGRTTRQEPDIRRRSTMGRSSGRWREALSAETFRSTSDSESSVYLCILILHPASTPDGGHRITQGIVRRTRMASARLVGCPSRSRSARPRAPRPKRKSASTCTLLLPFARPRTIRDIIVDPRTAAASRRTLQQAELVRRLGQRQRSLQILDGKSARSLLSETTRYLGVALPLSNSSLALASPCIGRLYSTLDRGRLRSLGPPPRLVRMHLWPTRSYMRTAHAQVCDTMRRDTTYPAPSPPRSRYNNRSTYAPVVSTKSRAATRSSGQRLSRLEIS
ncbi:hypothetical protein B0H14DRAFT_294345 [Mycena olivaceomarginata]|nr:hypothetical protein B0H14DRAFT_294345 [Mycena olivaceomarginata]